MVHCARVGCERNRDFSRVTLLQALQIHCLRPASLKDRNVSRAPQMKNRSGARTATPLSPIAVNRWVAIEKIITPVQKMEQKRAAIKDARKNHFISTNVKAIFQQLAAGHGTVRLLNTPPVPPPFPTSTKGMKSVTHLLDEYTRLTNVPAGRSISAHLSCLSHTHSPLYAKGLLWELQG